MKKNNDTIKNVQVEEKNDVKTNVEVKGNVKNTPAANVEEKKEVVKLFDPKAFVRAQVDICRTLEEAKQSKKSIVYLLGADGKPYQFMKTPVGNFLAQPDEVKGADELKEGFQLGLPKKISFHILCQVVSFFRRICDIMHDDEAMVQIFWSHKEQEYKVVCLEQTTTKTHITYLRNTELEGSEDYVLVADIHSHNTMNAFFSGTDDSSERETRLYGVFGKLNQKSPEHKFRMCLNGKFVPINMFDLFEKPDMKIKIDFGNGIEEKIKVPDNELYFPTVDFPEEWVETIKRGKEQSDKFRKYTRPTKVFNNDKEDSKTSSYPYPRQMSFGDEDYNYGYSKKNLSSKPQINYHKPSSSINSANDFMEAEEIVDKIEELGIFDLKVFADQLYERGLVEEIVNILKKGGYDGMDDLDLDEEDMADVEDWYMK